jgi:hypothetical protein
LPTENLQSFKNLQASYFGFKNEMFAINSALKTLTHSLEHKNMVRHDIKALKDLRKNKNYYKDTKDRRKELSLQISISHKQTI